MKTMFKVLAVTLVLSGTALAQARDINVGVSMAGEFQPGVYGQVNINTMPTYPVYSQPVVIVRQPVYYAAPVRPVYVMQTYQQDYRRCYHDRGHGHHHQHQHH
jgi:hypothetical protein